MEQHLACLLTMRYEASRTTKFNPSKTSFLGGILYGGGGYNFHQFYGIDYSDIYGNEIKTGRGQFVFHVGKPYSGSGFFPVFVKKVNLLAGADYVAADRIYVTKGNQLLRDKSLTSYHGGMQFDLNIAYLMPLKVDLIYAQVNNSHGQNETQFLTLITGSYFP